MNPQAFDGIGYVDFTWNPVTGCLRDCDYCYARGIAKRFQSPIDTVAEKSPFSHTDDFICYEGIYHCPFPFGFKPTLYQERLTEPIRRRKPVSIFVVDMGDLFGPWISYGWQKAIFDAVAKANQHKYLWLTKYPDLMTAAWERWKKDNNDICDVQQWYFGTTVINHNDMRRVEQLPRGHGVAGRWVSFEPLVGYPWPERYHLDCFDFAVIGPQTGHHAALCDPEWVADLLHFLHYRPAIRIWMKGDLYKTWPIRQRPEEMI